jgi:hypothetical protein
MMVIMMMMMMMMMMIAIILAVITVIGTTRNNSKSYIKYLRNLLGMHDNNDVQQTAILCTVHMYIRKY